MALARSASGPGGLSINTGAANSLGTSSSQPPAGGGLFGQPSTQAPASGGLFGSAASKPAGTGLFGSGGTSSSSQPQQSGGLFGSAGAQSGQQNQQQTQQSSGGLFGGGGAGKTTTTTQSQSGGLFGTAGAQTSKPSLFGSTTTTSQPQQSGGLFGGSTTTSQPQQSGGLFGGSTTTSQPQKSGGLFGGSTATSQPQQTSSLFGGGQQQKPAGGLFGGGSSTTGTQQQGSSLFGGGQQQNQSQMGSSILGGQQQQSQQTAPGVRVDLTQVKGSTKFDDLTKEGQDLISGIDATIDKVGKWKDEIAGYTPVHEQDIRQLAVDVAYLQNKYELVQRAVLEGDVASVQELRTMSNKNIDDAQTVGRAVENLKLPAHYHLPGLFTSTGASTSFGADPGETDLIGFFNRQCAQLQERDEKLRSYLAEIQQHMPNVEGGLYQKLTALQGQMGGSSAAAFEEMRATLVDMRNVILKQAVEVGKTREALTKLQVAYLNPML